MPLRRPKLESCSEMKCADRLNLWPDMVRHSCARMHLFAIEACATGTAKHDRSVEDSMEAGFAKGPGREITAVQAVGRIRGKQRGVEKA